MNVKNIKSQLKKIKRAVDLLQSDKKISALEIDLIRDYIRTLYELTLDDVPTIEHKSPEKKIFVPAPTPPVKKEIKKETPKNVEEVKEEKEVPKVEITEKPVPKAEIKVKAPKEKVVPATNGDNSDSIKSLFIKKEASDIAEKLSTLAVEDLRKAMSINEKIFTINELFDGNSQVFNDCLDSLEGFGSYDQAKDYLITKIAPQFDWTSTDKKKKAIKFIGLVQRRFN